MTEIFLIEYTWRLSDWCLFLASTTRRRNGYPSEHLPTGDLKIESGMSENIYLFCNCHAYIFEYVLLVNCYLLSITNAMVKIVQFKQLLKKCLLFTHLL